MISYFNGKRLSNNGAFGLGGINASGQVCPSYTQLLADFNSRCPDSNHFGKLGPHRCRHAKGRLLQAILEWRTPHEVSLLGRVQRSR